MTALIRAELLKLRTVRSHTVVVTIGLAFAAFLAIVTVGTAGQDGRAAAGSADDMVNVLGASGVAPFLAFVLGVLAIAGEFQHHTIGQTFLATPRRSRVVAAKVVALAIAGTAVAALVMVVALVASLPQLVVEGASVHIGNAQVGGAVGGNLLAGALFGVTGVGVGALLRNQLAAVAGAAAWALLGEGVLATVLGIHAVRWLPGFAAQAVVNPGGDLLTLPVAAAMLTLYAGAIAFAASHLSVTRDVS